jgi:hypothetical protein
MSEIENERDRAEKYARQNVGWLGPLEEIESIRSRMQNAYLAGDRDRAALVEQKLVDAENLIGLAKSWCDAGSVENGNNPEASLSWAIECYYEKWGAK